MTLKERVNALMACADHHLEQMDLLEDPDRTEPLTAWDRRQLTSHRGSLRRVLERAPELRAAGSRPEKVARRGITLVPRDGVRVSLPGPLAAT